MDAGNNGYSNLVNSFSSGNISVYTNADTSVSNNMGGIVGRLYSNSIVDTCYVNGIIDNQESTYSGWGAIYGEIAVNASNIFVKNVYNDMYATLITDNVHNNGKNITLQT
jgi:hypothetical protein